MNSMSKEFIKIADLKTSLLPHQKRVVEKLEKQDGLVAIHGLGSGKTLTSIAVQDKLNMPATIIVPAALKDNYIKERKKHLKNDVPIELISLQNIARKEPEKINPLLVIDEAHRLREPGNKALKNIKNLDTKKRLLLSASPFYNNPSDISSLINLAANEQILPTKKEEFEKLYIAEEKISPGFINKLLGVKDGVKQVINPKTQKKLKDIFDKWIDYHKGSTEHFPVQTEEEIKVPMTKEQLKIYDTLMENAPLWVSAKVLSNLPPSKSESKQLNSYLNAARQISNSTEPYSKTINDHPKIQEAVNKLKEHLKNNPNGKALVYSNYLDAGIKPYKQLLIKENIPFGEYTGELKQKDRTKLLEEYNEGKIKALLLSSAGGEGLDTKKTSLVQILEPHWNNEKLNQVKGRAIRYKSHEGLSLEEQKVLVQKFLSIRPKSGILEKLDLKNPGGSVDEYLYNRSKEKETLHNEFKKLLEKKAYKVWHQALDNKADDFLYLDGKKLTDFNERVKLVSDTAKVSLRFSPKINKKTEQLLFKDQSAFNQTRDQWQLVIPIKERDNRNRYSSIIITGEGKPDLNKIKKETKILATDANITPINIPTTLKYNKIQGTVGGAFRKYPKSSILGTALLGAGLIYSGKNLYDKYKEKTAKVNPYQQKTQWNCSAACLKTVLEHYGVNVDEILCALAIGTKPNRGAEVDQITNAAKKFGFDAFDKSLTIDEVKTYLGKDIPIIADVQSWTKPGSEHYIVVYKYDNKGFYIMDPNVKGNHRILSEKELINRWHGKSMYDNSEMKMWGIIITKKN